MTQHRVRGRSLRLALPAVAGVIAVILATGLPAAGSTPSRVKTVTSSIPISANTYVSPLAATPDTTAYGSAWAVYERHDAVGNALDPTGQLLAVTAKGNATVFGEVTPDMYDFSLSGDTLTAGSDRNPARVYWWQPPTDAISRLYVATTVSPGNRYLASAPDGWVEISSAGELYDVSASPNTSRALGNPFGSAQGVSGISGPTGIVVWNATKIDFVSFATGAVTPLDVSKLTNLAGGTNSPQCWSASTTTVACGSYYFTGEDNSGIRNVFLDPLSGAPAFAVATTCPQAATVLGRHAAWLCNGSLQLLGKNGLVRSPIKIGDWPVAGLGGYLTTNARHHIGIKVGATAKTSEIVLASTHATTHATQFALSAGSVVWLSNASSGGTVHRRTVRHNAADSLVNVGPVQQVATSRAIHGELASAGNTFAYPTELTNCSVGQHGCETLRVVTPTGHVAIHDVDRYLPVSIGDHRLAYYTDSRNARLYNLTTGKSSKLAVTGIALSGHWLAYADPQGTIRLKDLSTGTVRTVATGVQVVEDELFVRGQIVGWNAYPPGFGGHLAYYRDMATNATVVPLSTRVNIWQFSDGGMVLEGTPSAASSTTPSFPGDRALRFRPNLMFLLQPYDGLTAGPLLTVSYPIAGPQVAGGIVEWIDQHGRLKATALH